MKRLLLSLALLAASCGRREPSLPVYQTVPAFSLTDQSGERFSRDRLQGRVWIADFIFTRCPGPCLRMSARMKQLAKSLPPEAGLVSFTIDPDYDTPEVLARYAKRYQADPARWTFLTGSKQDLNRLSLDTFKLGEISPDQSHSTRFVLIDQQMRHRAYYDSTESDMVERITADVRALLGQ
ncbi:MAG: SCO family protein [Bryobacteraceae bacterium]|nr:SCO family protein [Bryobacteraceae bacterium]